VGKYLQQMEWLPPRITLAITKRQPSMHSSHRCDQEMPSTRKTRQAAALLESLFDAEPNHPAQPTT